MSSYGGGLEEYNRFDGGVDDDEDDDMMTPYVYEA
jgi:hypothetical protein